MLHYGERKVNNFNWRDGKSLFFFEENLLRKVLQNVMLYREKKGENYKCFESGKDSLCVLSREERESKIIDLNGESDSQKFISPENPCRLN